MKVKNIFFNLVLLAAFLVTACGAPAEDAMMDKSTEEAMMTEDAMMTEEAMMHETPTAEAMMTEEAMMESPAWYGVSLTDVQTGTVFSIQDFEGKVVLVETMAVWCPTCQKQQTQIKEVHSQLGMRDDLVTVSLDIDPNEDASVLKSYLDQNGFDWLYAVSPVDATNEIAATLGDQFLNPPSAPMFVIDRHGVAHPLPFGLKSADEIVKFIQPFLDENM
ncbi:MAG: TlpA family protein disulfide reductase [Chloroflexi bacterium]|nr:TlpA family protein disulfide reductase [Chloroflexota bacterium]MBI3169782.1 TlpA family protein disulfide reductase [Chloroflexota bacterium]